MAAVAIAVLTAGILTAVNAGSDAAHIAAVAAGALGAWLLVQLVGLAFLRSTQSRHALTWVAVVAGVVTPITILVLTLIAEGWTDALIVAGMWLVCAAGMEIAQGRRWSALLDDPGQAGETIRGLAVTSGGRYDGIPWISFLAGGVLAFAWAWLLDAVPWALPFAIVTHVASTLGIALLVRNRAATAEAPDRAA